MNWQMGYLTVDDGVITWTPASTSEVASGNRVSVARAKNTNSAGHRNWLMRDRIMKKTYSFATFESAVHNAHLFASTGTIMPTDLRGVNQGFL